MKLALSLVLGLGMALFLVTVTRADDEKKEVELKGTITCAKCDLKEAEKCHTVIKVEKDGKDTVYYFDKNAQKKYHGKICQTPKKGTVKGTVEEKDGKKWITVEKLDWTEE
jgi:hypothetical protein